ncbi:MAG: penicillin-binding protein 2 [Acidobacteria bacterium]|nr:penicillin-binding protein 2 [Acidobacteriota bacterium]
MKWLRAAFVLAFLILLGKLWQLSILEYQQYRELAERNRIRTIPEIAPRGLILDKEGRVLVDNARSFHLVLFREEIKDLGETVRFLTRGVRIDRETIETQVRRARHYASYQPVVIKEDLTMEEVSYLLAHQTEHPELRAVQQPRRTYRYLDLAAHTLGYVGEISEQELKDNRFQQHKPGDLIGKSGVERTYNELLAGRDGKRLVLVNSVGRTIEEIGAIQPVSGRELTLTLDLDLQLVAEEELKENPGAVVVINPQNGEVLALASRPAFDPNQFAVRLNEQEWERLISDPDDPLQNRIIQSTFSPGSVFKVVMALAGLEAGVLDPETEINCRGGASLYGNYFRCWKAGGHGRVNLRRAVQESCNVYFYLLGQKLGISRIKDFSQRLGLGLPTGIDLPGEKVGLIPSEEWKQKYTGQRWYAGETISVAIGQGPISVTPMQLARAIGIMATGTAPAPHLVKESKTVRAQRVPLPSPDFSDEHMQIIRDAMWSVVNESGTGRAARVPGFEVCGKTGTSQTISQSARARLSKEQAERFNHNAWFVGFAPRDNPEIVVAVIVQRGGGGGAVAAPIAGKILARYHEKHQNDRRTLQVAANASSAGDPLMQ